MQSHRRAFLALASAALFSTTIQGTAWAASFSEDASIPAPAGVSQLIYSAKHQRLIARVGQEYVYSINASTGAKVRRLPVSAFTDMALSVDGDYV